MGAGADPPRDDFPVFEVDVEAEAARWKKFSEPGVLSDEERRVNSVFWAINQVRTHQGDDDPVFGMDEDIFWKNWNVKAVEDSCLPRVFSNKDM